MPRETDAQQATRHAIRMALVAAEVAARPREEGSALHALPDAYHLGLDLCRRGQWHGGLYHLCQIDLADPRIVLPGTFFSYLGLAYARCEHRWREGRELCERAVSLEFYEPENWLNLAWTCVLARDRRRACDALMRGLAIDERNAGLRDLAQRLGLRRPPVLGFLGRSHPVNISLGKWRAALLINAVAQKGV